RNLICDFLLDSENICQLAVVLFTPQPRAIDHVDQLRGNDQGIAPQNDSAHEYRPDREVPAYRLGIQCLASVAEYSAARHDSQFGQPREAADEALGDAIAEILHVRVGAGIFKW